MYYTERIRVLESINQNVSDDKRFLEMCEKQYKKLTNEYYDIENKIIDTWGF